MVEHSIADGGYAAANHEVSQFAAVFESSIANCGHAVADLNTRQRIAAGKCVFTDARHAVRDLYARQCSAPGERPITNARHTGGDGICRSCISSRRTNQHGHIFAEQDTVRTAIILIIRINMDRCQFAAVFKRSIANCDHAVANLYTRQRSAAGECIFTNALNAVRDRDARQTTAIVERPITNGRHTGGDGICRSCISSRRTNQHGHIFAEQDTVRTAIILIIRINMDRCQFAAVFKRSIANFDHAVADLYTRQRIAAGECIFTNALNAVRDHDARQTTAFVERLIANARHAVGDRDTRQKAAAVEHTIANTRHAVGDRHAPQEGTEAERPIANARHAIFNHHGANLLGVIIPRSIFISIIRHRTLTADGQSAILGQHPGEVAALCTAGAAGDKVNDSNTIRKTDLCVAHEGRPLIRSTVVVDGGQGIA